MESNDQLGTFAVFHSPSFLGQKRVCKFENFIKKKMKRMQFLSHSSARVIQVLKAVSQLLVHFQMTLLETIIPMLDFK